MGERRGAYRVLVGNLRERDNLEETGVEGRIMDLQEVGCGGMDWIDQAHDMDRWRALADAATNLQVP
jgi:hypothetical protein